MPLKLDTTDMAILRALLADGRRSYREVSRQVGVSTPTVESRVKRLTQAGIIKKFTPVLDSNRVEGEMTALISLKVDLPKLDAAVATLSALEEVRNVFVTTGDSNLVIRVALPSNMALQDFLGSKISPLESAKLVSSQIITKTMKDEQGVALIGELAVSLVCDTCGQEVKGEPFILNVGGGKRFFCCKSCLSIYKEKYKAGLASIEAKQASA